MNVVYEVTIEKIRTSWDRPNYKWEVEVHDNPGNQNQNWDLRGSDYTFTKKRAYKAALKHVRGVQKDLEKGTTFGVIFTAKGSANEVVMALHDSK